MGKIAKSKGSKPIGMTDEAPRPIHWVMLIGLSLIWGSSFILIKQGLKVYSFEEVGAIRVVSAFLVLFPFALAHFRKVPREKWKYILAMGFLGNFIPAFLFAKAQTQLASSITGVLNALTPLFTFLVGIIAFGQILQRKQLIGLIVAFIGSAVLVFVNSNGEIGTLNFYVFFVIGAALCYATSTNIIKGYLTSIKSLHLTAFALSAVGPLGIFILINSDFAYKIQEVDGAVPALLFLVLLGVLGTSIALVIFNKMIQNTSAVFAASVTYLVPIIAITWGLIDNEVLRPLHYLCILTILAGVYITNRKKR
ncbi:MAG: DMT family transporter [Bacteroidota bacterium]